MLVIFAVVATLIAAFLEMSLMMRADSSEEFQQKHILMAAGFFTWVVAELLWIRLFSVLSKSWAKAIKIGGSELNPWNLGSILIASLLSFLLLVVMIGHWTY